MSLAGDWVVKYDNNNNTIANVQEIYLRVGRNNITDTWQVSQLRVVVWYPDPTVGIAGNLNLGDRLDLWGPANDTVLTQWTGRVSDMRQVYGIPYDDALGYAVADYLIIEAEGGLADWNRITTDGYTVTSTNARDAIIEVADEFGLDVTSVSSLSKVPIKPTTITGTLGGWLQDIIATGQLRVVDSLGFDGSPTVGLYLADPVAYFDIQFSDTTLDATHLAFDEIESDSLADNYYTQVIVSSPDVGEATSTLAGASPVRSLTISTLAATVAQCQDVADYVRQALDQPGIGIATVGAKTNGQVAPDVNMNTQFATLVRYGIIVDFRGVLRSGVIEGAELTVRPDGQRVTYHVSQAGYYSALVLDSATQGILDTNTLGLY